MSRNYNFMAGNVLTVSTRSSFGIGILTKFEYFETA